MNAEALIGTVLGTCTLQKLVGQGGMGAVFLAQQSRPRRQVAVKVLLPMTPLSPHQLAAFLERFRRETDAAASLEHPNITPVHEYGERDGLAYLVMPYISGGTLRDEMEREGPFSLEKVVNYLDQVAAALDFAHEHGVIHRDIKPANILLTPEGRLLLTDFGLVKIIAEGQAPQMRLTGPGAPVGTPDYMAPEQVIGEDVDTRADLYSLGIILYQMVTGTTPFQGDSPMQIAAQHLQIPPPSPQMLRPDLPVSAEQVMLRALAKRPSERYTRAQELASAFRMALVGTGVQLGMGSTFSGLSSTSSHLPTARNLFDLTGKSAAMPAFGATGTSIPRPTGAFPQAKADDQLRPSAAMPAFGGTSKTNSVFKPTGVLPTVKGGGLLSRSTGEGPAMQNQRPTGVMPVATNGSLPTPRAGGGLLSRTGKFPQVGTGTGIFPAASAATDSAPMAPLSPGLTKPLDTPSALLQDQTGFLPKTNTGALKTNTSALMVPGQQGSSTVKLTGPVKVVQVPVAGQPGRFVTGILPVLPSTDTPPAVKKQAMKPWMRITAVVMALLLLIGGVAGAVFFVRSHPVAPTSQTNKNTQQVAGTPDAKATAQSLVTATAQANIVLLDPLDRNVHNWQTTPADVYAFKDGAYHITNKGDNGRATVLQASAFSDPLGYTLTMQEVKGNDSSLNNSFGMIFRFNQQTTNGKKITTFYSFEVVNMKGGEYQFWKYDDTKGTDNAWTQTWHQTFGKEYHFGQGANSTNTFKVFMNQGKFTLTVNGKAVKTLEDKSFKSGTVGMIVNLNGTEVAFKNLLLTKN